MYRLRCVIPSKHNIVNSTRYYHVHVDKCRYSTKTMAKDFWISPSPSFLFFRAWIYTAQRSDEVNFVALFTYSLCDCYSFAFRLIHCIPRLRYSLLLLRSHPRSISANRSIFRGIVNVPEQQQQGLAEQLIFHMHHLITSSVSSTAPLVFRRILPTAWIRLWINNYRCRSLKGSISSQRQRA